jgi:hypothetical protein
VVAFVAMLLHLPHKANGAIYCQQAQTGIADSFSIGYPLGNQFCLEGFRSWQTTANPAR